MVNKFERTRQAFERAHDDLNYQLCTFYIYSTSYDPSTGKNNIDVNNPTTHAANVEVIQPSNANVSRDVFGTDSEIDVMFRLKDSETFISSLDVMGDDAEYPSQVETASGKRFKAVDTIFEQDSGFVSMPGVETSPPEA